MATPTGISGWRPFIETNSTVATTSLGEIWSTWNDHLGSTISAITTQGIWMQWNSLAIATLDIGTGFRRYQVAPPPPPPTAEQQLMWDWDDALREDRTRTQEKAHAIAWNKAAALLASVLDPIQKADFQKEKLFYMKSSSGRLYKIKTGKIHNIIMVDPVSKEELLELCLTTESHDTYPSPDVMLAQKLMLETREADALKLANIWDLKNNKKILNPDEKRRLIHAA
jgi:hypothetical protein